MGVRYIFGQDGAFRTEPVIVAKNITENGTYDPATEGADGYAPVVVNVEGGGGSSDFSTAEVTVINTTSNNVTASAVSVMDTLISAIVPFNTIGGNSNRSYIVPLYKGLCSWQITSGDVSVSVSGNINYEDGYVDITGDGTITIS